MKDTSEKKDKILVIDDDPCMVKLLGTRLSAHGFDVISAEDASVGLEMAVKQSPNLIILDVMMPLINGYNICRLLKEEEKLTTPIVMVTGRTTEEDKKIGQEVGVDAYLTKPLNTEQLFSTINGLLKKEKDHSYLD
ncbi:MAG: response regulator [Candidatus Omnitrophota bacterium]